MEVDDIALTLTPGIGAKGAAHLLGRFGTARGIFAASRDELVEGAQLRDELARRLLKREAFPAAERELVYCRRNGLVPIASTDGEYPALLRETPDYPHVLYVLGNVAVLRRTMLTMVGTRRMTCYGQQMAGRLVGELAGRLPGTVVVSGLAFGVDAACHRAALAFGLPTVGVVASVLPSITPAQHAALARDMIERGGAVVSELHSQSRQNGSFYLARNRILAGMSGGTVVVESPLGGGSMATARMADGYDRTVMAVPGRATDAMSAGVNALIRDRKAQLVLSGEDVVREMMWDVTRSGELAVPAPEAAPEFTGPERRLLGCFAAAGETVAVELLAERSGLALGELSALLLGLEMAGAIRQLPGSRYMRL
ncbi:MAG: DNA-processing protein DprA [Alistipes sp.]|nr:DNA-processing protein DprA [Alistipes sp.]